MECNVNIVHKFLTVLRSEASQGLNVIQLYPVQSQTGCMKDHCLIETVNCVSSTHQNDAVTLDESKSVLIFRNKLRPINAQAYYRLHTSVTVHSKVSYWIEVTFTSKQNERVQTKKRCLPNKKFLHETAWWLFLTQFELVGPNDKKYV